MSTNCEFRAAQGGFSTPKAPSPGEVTPKAGDLRTQTCPTPLKGNLRFLSCPMVLYTTRPVSRSVMLNSCAAAVFVTRVTARCLQRGHSRWEADWLTMGWRCKRVEGPARGGGTVKGGCPCGEGTVRGGAGGWGQQDGGQREQARGPGSRSAVPQQVRGTACRNHAAASPCHLLVMRASGARGVHTGWILWELWPCGWVRASHAHCVRAI